jgi:hypothetical protein
MEINRSLERAFYFIKQIKPAKMAFKRVLGKKLKNYFIIELDYSISNSFIQAFIISYVLFMSLSDQLKNELIISQSHFSLFV